MRASLVFMSLLTLPLFGAGCASFTATDLSSEEVDLHAGATLSIDQNWLGISGGSNEEYGLRKVTIDAWEAGKSAKLSWTRTVREETEASKAAREAAASAPIGTAVTIPDPVYEDITTSGTITTDALGNAERMYLPSYWPTGEEDLTGEENSVLWLSRAQYDELVATRSSHLAIGFFDSGLATLEDFGDQIASALAALQGDLAADESTTNTDITKLTAEGDWGDDVLVINGTKSRVKTIEAQTRFANFVVLANPENPLILKVSLRPLAFGLGMFSTMSALESLAGYSITSINY